MLEKRIKLECSIPVSFDFEVTWIHSSSNFTVAPMKGSIPANGSIEVVVQFTPDRLCLSTGTFQVIIHEHKLKTCLCEVMGSSVAGVTRQRKIEELSEAHNAEVAARVEKLKRELASMDNNNDHFNNKSAESYVKVHNDILRASIDKKSGVLSNIPFTTYSVSSNFAKRYDNDPGSHVIRDIHAQASRKHRNNPVDARVETGESDTLDFPEDLAGMAAANYVLTQEPGKLKLKNLKLAIAKQRELKAEREKEKEMLLKQANQSDLDTVTQILSDDKTYGSEASSRQMKELVFVQQLRDIEKDERSLEFSTQKQCSGDPLLPEADIAKIMDARKLSEEKISIENRERDRKYYDVHDGEGKHMDTQAQLDLQQRATTLPYANEETKRYLAELQPTFDVADNEDFFMRKRTTMRFILLVSKIVIKNRASKRLRDIWDRIGDVRDKGAIVEMVKQDNVEASQRRAGSIPSSNTRSGRNQEEWTNYKEKIKSLHFVRKRRYSVETDASSERSDENRGPAASQGESQSKLEDDHVNPPQPPNEIEEYFTVQLPIQPDTISSDTVEACVRRGKERSGSKRYFHYPIYEQPTVLNGDSVTSRLLRGFYRPTFFSLQQPEEYKLLGHAEYDVALVPDASIYYVSEEELETLEPPHRCVPSNMQVIAAGTEMDRLLNEKFEEPDIPLPRVMEDRCRVLCFERTENMYHEADPEFSLQPKEVAYSPEETLEYTWTRTPGLYPLRALSNEPTISDFTRPARTEVHADLRGLEQFEISTHNFRYLTGPLEEDAMSDPGEDDEFLTLKKASEEKGVKDENILLPATIREKVTLDGVVELLLGKPSEIDCDTLQSLQQQDEARFNAQIKEDREGAARWLPAQLERVNDMIQNEQLKFKTK